MKELHIVLTRGPDHNSDFVECEDEKGQGLSVGRWEKRGEYWHLILSAQDLLNHLQREAPPAPEPVEPSVRREFEMTVEERDGILEACRPTPMVALHCGAAALPQERANAAWAALGKKMGFDWKTVEESPKGDRFFTAIPV